MQKLQHLLISTRPAALARGTADDVGGSWNSFDEKRSGGEGCVEVASGPAAYTSEVRTAVGDRILFEAASGSAASTHLVEEGKDLVGGQVELPLNGGHVPLLQAQHRQNGCLSMGQCGGQATRKVSARQ